MIKILVSICLIFCALQSNAQNLIPNPSFEDTLKKTGSFYAPIEWISANNGSPDYYTNLNTNQLSVPQNFAGFQYAKSGNSYMGLVIYSLYRNANTKRSREYIQVKLNRTLTADSTYCLQLFLSLSDSSRFASRNQLGVYLSSNKVSSNDVFRLPYIPQIIISPIEYITEKKKWLEYNFEYKAIGGEQYITIGNFNDTNVVDTVHVVGGIEEFYQNTYYYIDNLFLGSCDSVPLDTHTSIVESTLLSKIKGYPNPVKEQFTLENNSNKPLSFQLYSLYGSKLQVAIQQSNKKYSFSMGHLPKGVYLLQVIGENEQSTLKLIKD